MARSILRHAFGVTLCAVIVLTSLLRAANADVLAEYFFWDRMGSAAGKAVGEYQNYRRERELWSRKIAEAKAELQRCGGCAGAQAELDKWQGIENRFQDVAGSLAASVGMPNEVAGFLGIKKSLFAPRSEADRKRECTLVAPEWANQRPAFCRQAVDEHYACLRDYQKNNGMCSWQNAGQTGGACWQTRKLFAHCAVQDYDAFEREKAGEALRRSDPSVPEIIAEEGARINLVMYQHADDDFALSMPPRDVIDRSFEENEALREIHFLIDRTRSGPLWRADIKPFSWKLADTETGCDFMRRPDQDDELQRRDCNDISEAEIRAMRVIACWYMKPAYGVPPDAVYWYGERAPLVDARRLLERDRRHPLADIGDPRTDCPATEQDARRLAQTYRMELAALKVDQIPATEILAPSDFLQETYRRQRDVIYAEARDRLATFPIEGFYFWSTDRRGGTAPPGTRPVECLVSSAGEREYDVSCKGRRLAFSGHAEITVKGLLVSWDDGTQSNFNDGTARARVDGVVSVNGKRRLVAAHPDNRDHTYLEDLWKRGRVLTDDDAAVMDEFLSTPNSYYDFLSREGNVSLERFVEVVAAFPFEGAYTLTSDHEGETVELFCKVERNSSYRGTVFDQLCYDGDGRLFKAEVRAEQRTEGLPVLKTFSFYPDVIVGGERLMDVELPFDPSSSEPDTAIFKATTEKGLHVRLARTNPETSLPFTPLEELNKKKSEIESIRKKGVDTVEQLAALSDEHAHSRGINLPFQRDAARAFLTAKGGAAPVPGRDGGSVTPRKPKPSTQAAGKPAPAIVDEGLANCPTNFAQLRDPTGKLDCACPSGAGPKLVHGADIYTDVSSVCTAARHAGMIDEAGGVVHLEGVSGLRSYAGVERNGVSSKKFGAWPRAFRFIGDGPGSAAAPAKHGTGENPPAESFSAADAVACPPAFREFGDPRGRFECVCAPPWRKYLYGTDIYTDTSSVCDAARHAGVIGEAGGPVRAIGIAGVASYVGSRRNGAQSNSWGTWPGAFLVQSLNEAAPPLASNSAAPACPQAFRDLHDPQAQLECNCLPPWSDYLYGTGIYTDTSSVCAAAQHAGLIGPNGGAVVVIGVEGVGRYEGTVQNEVRSKSWGVWPRAFRLSSDGPTAPIPHAGR